MPLARGRGRVGYQYEFCLNKDHSKAVREALKKEYPQMKIRVKIDDCNSMVAWLVSGNQKLNDDNFEPVKEAIEQTMMDALKTFDDTEDERVIVFCYLGDWTKNQDYIQNAESSAMTYNAEMDANVLFRQLGGNRFRAMTGAKDFMKDGNSLRMKIMKNNTGGNHLIITLNSNDLYDMRFESHRMNRKTYELTIKVKAEETNIPASNLQRVFTELSGLYTRMAEQSFNAEKFVGDFNKSWEGVHYWQACPNSIIEGGSNENCKELEFVGYDDEARVMCPNCKETWPIESRESFTAYKFGADEEIEYQVMNRPRKKYERNYKHWVDGTGKILRKEVFINPNNKDDIEIIVVLVKEGNEYKVGEFGDGRFWGKKTFATKKEAIEYFNLSVKRSKCEHESGFKLSDPDSTFYDSHERFHFYCCDCGVSALGDVEPDFRYFGEDNDDSYVFEVESFNADNNCNHEIMDTTLWWCKACDTKFKAGEHNKVKNDCTIPNNVVEYEESCRDCHLVIDVDGIVHSPFNAEIDGEELIASSANFDDGSMIVGVGTETLDVDNPDFMEMMIDKDGKIEYFTLPIGKGGWDRHYNIKPSHYGKMKTQNETNETAGGDFIRTDGDGKYAESFGAESVKIDWDAVAKEEWDLGYPHNETFLTYQNKQANKSLLSCLNAHLKIAKDEVTMGHNQYPDLAEHTITPAYEEAYGREPTTAEIDKALPKVIKGLRKQARTGKWAGDDWEELSKALKSPLSRYAWGIEDYTGRKGWFGWHDRYEPLNAETFNADNDEDWEYPVKVISYSVDVYKDDYEQGEIGDSVHYWGRKDDFYFDTKAENQEELLKILNKMIKNEVGGKVPIHENTHFGFEIDEGRIYTDVHATYEEGQGMGIYDYPKEHEREAWKRGEKELFTLNFTFVIEPIDESYAETKSLPYKWIAGAIALGLSLPYISSLLNSGREK